MEPDRPPPGDRIVTCCRVAAADQGGDGCSPDEQARSPCRRWGLSSRPALPQDEGMRLVVTAINPLGLPEGTELEEVSRHETWDHDGCIPSVRTVAEVRLPSGEVVSAIAEEPQADTAPWGGAWLSDEQQRPVRLDLVADPRTGLRVLTAAAMRSLRPGAVLAVVDLVRFAERVNAPHNHIVGDRVLREVGARLSRGLAPRRVFRTGGDEFTVEVTEPLDLAGAARLAERVRRLLAAPFEDLGVGLEAQVGVSLMRISSDPQAVLDAANAAAAEAARRKLRLYVADASATIQPAHPSGP
jgi:GGDEF domain-containing protein